jgi:L-malate glycosyltransferase
MPEKKINVLLISSWYPTRITPTNGNFVEKHAESVALFANVDVLHVCFDPSLKNRKEYAVEKKNHLTIHRIYLRKYKIRIPLLSDIFKFFRIIHNYYYGFRLIYKGKTNPDIVHANILIPIGFIAYLFRITKKIPYIVTEHWTGYLQKKPTPKVRFLFLYRTFAKKAAALTPVTDNLADAMKGFSIKGNFHTVPNVVDTKLFTLKEESKEPLKHILHISSLDDKQKNFSGIISALSELTKKRNDFVLDVISEGNFTEYLPQVKAAGLENKIIFHGLKQPIEVAAIMKQYDFLLLFSNYENFPCVIAEAMACGLPVISTDVGGIAEHVNTNTGILIKKGDISDLVQKLDIMLDSYRKYDANAIREYAENIFSYEVVGKQYVQIYQQFGKFLQNADY